MWVKAGLYEGETGGKVTETLSLMFEAREFRPLSPLSSQQRRCLIQRVP